MKTIDSTRHLNYLKRGKWILLLGLFILLLDSHTSSLAQQGNISIGDTVEITSGQGLRLHREPGLKTEIVVTLPYKTQMKVVGGPSVPTDGIIWWELDGTPGHGWAAESYLKVVDGAPGTTPSSDSSGCEQPYPAIKFCPQTDKSTYAISVDLDNPHVRVETIMANDTKSVNTGNREFVSHMGDRYKTKGAAVVINADYFGGGHGPEGFTVVNGERLDGLDKNDDDLGDVYRSSIAFSKAKLDGGNSPIQVSIQRFPEDRFPLDADKMFNAVGGGPQIVFNESWDWTRGRNQDLYKDFLPCKPDIVNDDVINGECFRDTKVKGNEWDNPAKIWTVVGKAANGRLFVLFTTYPNVKSVLAANQVQEAIKLDGGGSSQLWYNGQPIIPGDGRQVADGLAIFYKNDYSIIEQPQLPVVVSGERLDLKITLKNTGADTWTQKDYGVSIVKSPWDMSLQSKLPKDVRPGETVTITWQSAPIDRAWGFQSFDLQLVDHGNPFPMKPILVRAIVIPQDLAEKKQELEQKIREWIDKGVDNIEQEITKWIERQLNGFWKSLLKDCNLSLTALIVVALILYCHSHLP